MVRKTIAQEIGVLGMLVAFLFIPCHPVLAQTPVVYQNLGAPTVADRITALESELASLREAVADQSPPATVGPTGVTPMVTMTTPCCTRCGCASNCQCPLDPAACVDCPRVSTLGTNFQVNVFGAVVTDLVFSEPRAVAPGTPFFLLTPSSPGFDEKTVSFHARQSNVGAALTGPSFGGWQSGGLVLVNFFNDALIVDQYGVLPLQAYGELRNDRFRIAAGLQFDVFNPNTPWILPFSLLSASGNSGNAFRGQVRIERFVNVADDVQWTGQLALSDPVPTTVNPAFRVLEDNGWPNVESRLALGIGQQEMVNGVMRRPFEISLSGVVGQMRTTIPGTTQVVTDVWGAGGDFRWKFLPSLGVAGEIYHGEGLGTYNGGILQNVNEDLVVPANSTYEAIESTGGWLETFVYWTPCLHSHVGYGIDNPEDLDLGLGQRSRNSTYFANLIWDVNSSFRLASEFTYRETEYNFATPVSNEGPGYHFQLQWLF